MADNINRYDRWSEFSRSHDDSKTQKELCLEYLKKNGSITALEALGAFGCFRLAAIIYKLREDGYVITTDINDGKKKYAIYTLIKEGEEQDG